MSNLTLKSKFHHAWVCTRKNNNYIDCFMVSTSSRSPSWAHTYLHRQLHCPDGFTVSTLCTPSVGLCSFAIWCRILIWAPERISAFNVSFVSIVRSWYPISAGTPVWIVTEIGCKSLVLYVIMVVAYVLAPNIHQAISNHHVDLTLTTL